MMKKQFGWNVVAMMVATGCVGAGGKEGAPALVRALPVASTTACPGGGIVLLYGADDGEPSGTSRDGVLDEGEVDNPDRESPIVCHGAVGQVGENGEAGANGLECWDLDGDGSFDVDFEDIDSDGIATTADCRGAIGAVGENGAPGQDGANCWEAVGGDTLADCIGDDGQSGLACWDLDGDRSFDVAEDADEDGVPTAGDCKGRQGDPGEQGEDGNTGAAGAAGPNGLNAVVKTTIESAGANCPTGGIKLEVGIDGNGSGSLDPGEVVASQTRYLCNGAMGATGATGSAGTNGTNAMIASRTPTGAECPNGGTVMQFGMDTNRNGALDPAERTEKPICNGAKGDTGTAGPQGTPGTNGTNGSNGSVGDSGDDGANCWDAIPGGTTVDDCVDHVRDQLADRLGFLHVATFNSLVVVDGTEPPHAYSDITDRTFNVTLKSDARVLRVVWSERIAVNADPLGNGTTCIFRLQANGNDCSGLHMVSPGATEFPTQTATAAFSNDSTLTHVAYCGPASGPTFIKDSVVTIKVQAYGNNENLQCVIGSNLGVWGWLEVFEVSPEQTNW